MNPRSSAVCSGRGGVQEGAPPESERRSLRQNAAEDDEIPNSARGLNGVLFMSVT